MSIFGQVMGLVAAALLVATGATLLAEGLDFSTARILSFAGLGVLILSSFVNGLRTGALGVAVLFLVAALIGAGMGPFIGLSDPATLTNAIGLTALTVVGMAALGFTMNKDTVTWMRPLSLIVLVAVVVSIVGLIFGGLGVLSPVISLVILVASAGLILVDFNYIRKHATEDDVVWLATGIFVSIINIFLSFLNLTD